MEVPKLRFKEFNDEWKKIKLDRVVSIFDGTHQTPHYTKNGIKFLSVENIRKLEETHKYISENDFNKDFKIYPQKDDILMTRIGDIGTPNIIRDNQKYAFYVSLALFKRKKRINMAYLLYLIQTVNFQRELWKRTLHIAFPKKINKNEISEICINYSNNEMEQEKIANFLSLLDKKIELQKQKIEAFKIYKMGLMNKTYNEKNEMKIKKIGDICEVEKGKQLNRENMLDNGKYYVLNGGSELSGYADNYNTEANTITISEGGNSCGFVNYNKERFWAGGHCYILKKLNSQINLKYLYQTLKFNEKKIMMLRVGSGLPNIQKTALENFEIYIHTREHQNKISNMLEKLDKKIYNEEKKQKQLNTLKKGLLQEMFV